MSFNEWKYIIFFVILSNASDLLPFGKVAEFFGIADSASIDIILFFIMTLGSIAMVMIFLPPIIVYVWGCKPLEDHFLKEKLDSLCARAHFTHAGFKTWTIMEDAMTAAIIGVIGRFRYVMFTKKLLEKLSPDAITAILAHEIGHSRRKHLILYPFVLLCSKMLSFYLP